MFHLIEDWRAVLLRAWSARLALASAGLTAVEFAIQYIAPERPSGMFALAAGLTSLAAAVARLVAQPKLRGLLDEAKDERDAQADAHG